MNVNRSTSSPDATSAASSADAPGMGQTRTPASAAARTSRAPGSESSGVPASDNTIKVSKDMGISTSAAYNIVVNAINHLGC